MCYPLLIFLHIHSSCINSCVPPLLVAGLYLIGSVTSALDLQLTLDHLKLLVVNQVASKWEGIALYLGMRQSVVEIVLKNIPRNCERACREMFRRWLAGGENTGDKPRTWGTVLKALEENGYQDYADELRRGLMQF